MKHPRVTSGIAIASIFAALCYVAFTILAPQPEVLSEPLLETAPLQSPHALGEPDQESASQAIHTENLNADETHHIQTAAIKPRPPLNLKYSTDIERSPAQQEQLNNELELWETMMSSEYASYSPETLISLAEQGDPIAFHQLIVDGDISVDDMQRLAKQLGKQGYPMIYGFAADGIFGSTNDKILAMAYYMAAVNHGSELMRQFELDYKVWFRLEDDEVALAAELAAEL